MEYKRVLKKDAVYINILHDNPDEFPYRETEAEAEKDMERFIDWLLIN